MNADSIKARLKNYAVSSGCTFQEALVYYGLERTIYRISVSPYADHFVLKGGIFLYAIYDRKYARATTDVDFLARRISNSAEEMKKVFRDIFSQDEDDALVFDLDSIVVEDITEFKEYHGLHITVAAYLDRTRISIGIDIGFGDIIYPNAVEMDFPAHTKTPRCLHPGVLSFAVRLSPIAVLLLHSGSVVIDAVLVAVEDFSGGSIDVISA